MKRCKRRTVSQEPEIKPFLLLSLIAFAVCICVIAGLPPPHEAGEQDTRVLMGETFAVCITGFCDGTETTPSKRGLSNL